MIKIIEIIKSMMCKYRLYYAEEQLKKLLISVYPDIQVLDRLEDLISQVDNGFAVPLKNKKTIVVYNDGTFIETSLLDGCEYLANDPDFLCSITIKGFVVD